MPTSLDHVSRGIRSLRKERGMSQAELAEAAGVSTKLVSAIEQGDRSPSLDTLDKLCRALTVTPLELFAAGEPSVADAARGVADVAVSMFHGLSEVQSERMLTVMRGVRELVDAEKKRAAASKTSRRGTKPRRK
jgi:transcriptional regulator with XRE-family HTH domain